MASPAWFGFRIETTQCFDSLLATHIADWLTRMKTERALRRWFFLRYSEGGLHLRLRLQPQRESIERLTAEFERFALQSEPPLTVERQVYDRARLAFGETRESVLAELLHESTSELAMQFLRLGAVGARRGLLTVAAAIVLLEDSLAPRARLDAIRAWSSFTVRTANTLGFNLPPAPMSTRPANVQAIAAAVPRVRRVLEKQVASTRAARLLRRLNERGERGQFVAIHGLHLFCNEMGVLLSEEHVLTRLLAAWGETFWANVATGNATNGSIARSCA